MSGAESMLMQDLISDRCKSIDVSGIRRVFELGAKLADPINLSIGQPDFAVPDAIKDATIDAIRNDANGYSLTQGAPQLLEAVNAHMQSDLGWDMNRPDLSSMVTSGTSGALILACMAMLNPGDEMIIPDPYFVIYPAHATLNGATPVYCDTYPDGRMTAERIEPLITERTKIVLINSPGNPTGAVLSEDEVRAIAELCDRKGVLLVSDEIYDEFTFSDAQHNGRCPSPARYTDRCLVIRGFGKTYGCTGWRLGYAAGPTELIVQMMKLQQYTFVCAPSMAQVGITAAFDVDMAPHVQAYERRRDMVMSAFDGITNAVRPGGAFYAFIEVPEALGCSATEFVERAIERNVLVIPGGVFSLRDTHFRLSFAAPEERVREGVDILVELARG